MKNRIPLIVLVLLSLGLGIGLIMSRKQAAEDQSKDAERIDGLSNKWVTTTAELESQKQVNAMLEKDLNGQKRALNDLTNQFTQVSANLAKTSADLDKTQTSLKTAQDDIAKRDSKISELEAQNQALDKQALDLSGAITNLTLQITQTQQKLATTEGDKAYLEKELKRLMSEKAELERQFNDLTILKAQVVKLKEELNIARRIEWIRQGIFANTDQKGAQRLMQGAGSPGAQPKAPKPSYDLNVEVSSDGSVKVIPPLGGSTNAPPPK